METKTTIKTSGKKGGNPSKTTTVVTKKQNNKPTNKQFTKVKREVKAIKKTLLNWGARGGDRGYKQLISAMFDPSSFASRLFANTTSKSAICKIRQRLTINCTGSDDLVMFWFPYSALAPNFFQYGFAPPFTGTFPGITLTDFAGPLIPSNPSEEYRIVAAEMRIDPVGSMLNQQGSTIGGVFASWPGAPSDEAVTNADFSYQGSNMTPIIAHYFPHDTADTNFGNVSAINEDAYTYVSHVSGLQAGVSFNISFTTIIEYIPTNTFRPFVDLRQPTVRLDCWSDLNLLIGSHPALVLGPVSDWNLLRAEMEGVRFLEGYTQSGYSASRTGGKDFVDTLKKQPDVVNAYVQGGKELYNAGKAIYGAFNSLTRQG